MPDADGPGLFTVLSSAVPVVLTFGSAPENGLDHLTQQAAAFFGAGIVCTDEAARERLWWRREEAQVLAGDGSQRARSLLTVLRGATITGPTG